MASMPSIRVMYRAAVRRDASYDGIFFLAVRTTGVFCRPSCPARKPVARNIEYFHTAAAALSAGYRPCRRCRPLATGGEPPEWLQPLLRRIDREPDRRLSDDDLRSLSLEPSRVRRYFRGRFGSTFQAFHRALRMGRALGQLRRGADWPNVAWKLGYQSASGFREAFGRTFGRTPGGRTECTMVHYDTLTSPVGPLLVAADDEGICLVEFIDRRGLGSQIERLKRRMRCTLLPGRTALVNQLEIELGEYFSGQRTRFTVPLVVRGTPFQEKVWKGLLEIPFGRTCSYEQLARQVGRTGAQRAVGRANGDNRIAILIPCHRVVAKDGSLHGYGGGLWRKRLLLDLERRVCEGRAKFARHSDRTGDRTERISEIVTQRERKTPGRVNVGCCT